MHRVGRVATGGTVFDITIDIDGRIWTASPAGLFKLENEGWLPVLRSLPFVQVSAVTSNNKTLFTAGLPDGLVYSLDGGRSWYRAWTDQVSAPVTCFAISPNYDKDNVLLAGSDGDGILRTTDGGRHWSPSNFGLRGFSVYNLASIGVAQTFRGFKRLKEIVYAGTDDGVYISPNGGRAWKPAGTKTAGTTVLGLALSPNFATDQTLFAGTEAGDIFRSMDGGVVWTRLETYGFSTGSINALFCGEDGSLLIGTSQEGILRTLDDGATWEKVTSNDLPVLKITQGGDRLYAGYYEGGIAVSEDNGNTWKQQDDIAARRFEWLAVPKGDLFFASGPGEGIWTSVDCGKKWTLDPSWPEDKPLLGLSAQDDVVLAAAPDGVWRKSGTQDGWTLVLEAEKISAVGQTINTQFHLSCVGSHTLGGGGIGGLWLSHDRGQQWAYLDTQFTGLPVIALALSPHFAENNTLVVCVTDESTDQVQLWGSRDSGVNWSMWHSVDTQYFAVRMVISESIGTDIILGIGDKIHYQGLDGWDSSVISSESAPVSALAVLPESDTLIAAVTDQVIIKTADEPWKPLESMEGVAVIAMVRSPNFSEDHTLYTLTSDGVLYQYNFD
jgi:photosystem II stability/assembly factor-like uncharacterized protein